MTYWGPDEKLQEWCVPDSVTFMTSLIANALIPFKNEPKVATLLKRSANFLQYQIMRGGVWQFFTKWHKAFKYSAPDVDDTALASLFLQNMNIGAPNNLPMLLANRNKEGLFYTWFTWRVNFSFHKNYWLLLLREFKEPIRTLLYWKRNEITRNDLDAVVNANVLLYLGYREVTAPIVKFIINIIKADKETQYDRWYQNPIVIYYFISRLFSLNIQELEQIRSNLTEKLLTAIQKSNDFYNTDLEMALALSGLINLGYKSPLLNEIAKKLIEAQKHNGEWRRNFLYVVPSYSFGWGSEEVTTAFCIEALNAYKNYINLPAE